MTNRFVDECTLTHVDDECFRATFNRDGLLIWKSLRSVNMSCDGISKQSNGFSIKRIRR